MESGAYGAEYDEGTGTLTVSGDVDESAAAALRDAIESHSQGFARGLVVDLSGVAYLPSTAIGVLATSQKRAQTQGTTLELLAASGTIAERVLVVCALPHRTS